MHLVLFGCHHFNCRLSFCCATGLAVVVVVVVVVALAPGTGAPGAAGQHTRDNS